MQIIPRNINAAETRKQAKELYLKRQRAQVIARLKGADDNERKSVIKHIDSFLHTTTPDGKTFWLKIRREVERQIEQSEVSK